MKYHRWLAGLAVLLVAALLAGPALAEHQGKIQVLLLGDSTTLGSVCRKVQPKGPHLEDVIRLLIAAEGDLPPTNVINRGKDGDYIDQLLTSDRYEEQVANLPGIDYVFIRYGLNDQRKREDFESNFPADYKKLIAKLREDFPQATIILATSIPYRSPEDDAKINEIVRRVAAEEQLSLFDIHTRYRAELARGINTLNYRRIPLEKIPEKHHSWLEPFIYDDAVIVMDNRLDAHFGGLPGWYDDRHPNFAGYHVIADETAKFLIPLIRERQKAAAAK